MIRDEINELPTGPRDLRKFGLIVGGVFALLGSWFLFRHKPHYPFFLWPGTTLIFLGLVIPRSLRPIYIGWMTVAFILGLIVSATLLTIFFYLVVTPIGLIAKCFGKDFLDRKLRPEVSTYWLTRDNSKKRDPSEYQQQF